VINIIKSVATLDAESTEVGRAVASFDTQNLVVFDMVSQQATNTAIGANRVNFAVRFNRMCSAGITKRAGGAGGNAFTAGHAGTFAHRVAEIEYDFCMVTALSETDDIVDLGFTAGAQAPCALNAGIEIDRDRRV